METICYTVLRGLLHDNEEYVSSESHPDSYAIIGVPAAFSPTCSDSHIPSYISSPKTKHAGKVYVVSVNDAFVMNAWGKTLDADKKSGVRATFQPFIPPFLPREDIRHSLFLLFFHMIWSFCHSSQHRFSLLQLPSLLVRLLSLLHVSYLILFDPIFALYLLPWLLFIDSQR